MKYLLITLLCFCCLNSGIAQDTLTNKSVIRLTKAGFSSSIIITKIITSQCSFSLTIEDLLALKEAKVSDAVINSMMERQSLNTEKVKNEIDDEKVFTKVEIDPSFPGGEAAWNRYINKQIADHIDELKETGESGKVRVRFIVDKNGNISNVEALTIQNTKLAEVATAAIAKGPRWTPAQQNGRYVKAYKEINVVFTQ